jgi:DNA-binding NarL/FixJ family response regulator
MRVVIAEDSVLLREGLRSLLEDSGIEVVGTAGDAAELLTAVADHLPDLALVDVRMPPSFTDEGLQAALEIRRTWPEVGLLVLSQYVEEQYAADLIGAGTRAIGYLLKDRVADVGVFIESVRNVAGGGAVIDPEVVAQLVRRRRTQDTLDRLTSRELDVLSAMAEGRSNAAIADACGISIGSVEKHISSIFMKLDLAPEPDDHRRVLAVLTYLHR